jgi:hypothetical protein
MRRERHGGRQSARHVGREARAGQDRDRGGGAEVAGDVAEEEPRAPLDPLRAQDQRDLGPQRRAWPGQGGAYRLRRDGHKGGLSLREGVRIGRRADRVGKADTGEARARPFG